MIHAIIYANRDRGYDLYDRSPGFPEQDLPAVRRASELMCSARPVREDRARIRFCPTDGGRYLLTTCISQPEGNKGESRGHHTGVTFLMNASDADRLLEEPERALDAARARMEALLEGSERPARMKAEDFLEAGSGPEKVSVPGEALQRALLMAAWYAAAPGKQGQVMIVSGQDEESPDACLGWLCRILPPDLRRLLTFHTGILTAAEGSGTVLKFADPASFSSMKARDFEGGDRTALALFSAGELTSFDQRADKAADRLLAFASKKDLKGTCLRARDQTKAFLSIADGKEPEMPAGQGDRTMESRKNRKEHRRGSLLPALLLQVLTCALALTGLFFMVRKVLDLTLDKGGEYLLLSLGDARTLILCGGCLAAGVVLGVLLTLLIQTLSRLGE